MPPPTGVAILDREDGRVTGVAARSLDHAAGGVQRQQGGQEWASIVAEGDIVRTSTVMRQAAVVNGGLIYAARAPLTAGFIKENGAAGAITFQLDLGRAMLAARKRPHPRDR